MLSEAVASPRSQESEGFIFTLRFILTVTETISHSCSRQKPEKRLRNKPQPKLTARSQSVTELNLGMGQSQETKLPKDSRKL